ncbi:MAG: HAMP domain-containing histidine kinase [Lachnospiraceae bacterium]|nr:HAMP domain-containing histidine kinase [Lachnospiraceae bacterium]
MEAQSKQGLHNKYQNNDKNTHNADFTENTHKKQRIFFWKRSDSLPWLLALACMDLISLTMLWLADVEAFGVLSLANGLCSLLLFAVILIYSQKKGRQKEAAFLHFLESPDPLREGEALRLAGRPEAGMVQKTGRLLREAAAKNQQLSMDLDEYEEYVEAWAHEVKTPISLLTFLMDNHRQELPPSVARKLDYVQCQMQESVSQMLYYARLKSVHKDYLLEPLCLEECCQNALGDYKPLLEENRFCLSLDLPGVTVLSDQRGVEFLLRQMISNSIKYCRDSGIRKLRLWAPPPSAPDGQILLHIADNGIGVQPCDLPFLFEKGFTGGPDSNRKKATGMGLYLAKAVADDLNIALDVQSSWGEGFEITLRFPQIETAT